MIRSGFAPLAELMEVIFDEIEVDYKKNLASGMYRGQAVEISMASAGKHLAEMLSLRGFVISSNYDNETAEKGVEDCVCRAYRLTNDKGDFIGLLFQELNIHLDISLPSK